MRLFPKLVVFAAGLTGVLAIMRVSVAVRDRHDDHDEKEHANVEVVEVEAPVPALPALPPIPPLPAAAAHPAEALVDVHADETVRIITANRAAFMSLRDEHLVAGLSDSIRRLVSVEMKKELDTGHSGVGERLSKAIRSGVEKMLDKEIAIPLSDIEKIDYKGKRIVIVYKHGEPRGVINLETIKGDGNKTILEQFSEGDARKLVQAVKERIR
ncbi:MAG: hypothetical protein ACT4P7_23350 [Gemmatimonadaceae bacterium]